ncbi:hypothetical protein BDP27DRAFT_1424802 [Rhodocollybia butyracea]|uniref:Chromo domain-containing protein n=1 Tax=Rhodocollybia butyracea TaxID=206335 RepID=A0A9P5U415_9AGAR|nr:hypothetical protein BDP27DRAFT_1424802 [Rhodocollybia butyracea]
MDTHDQYEVGFIRKTVKYADGRRVYQVHWKGWRTADETYEDATSLAQAGNSVTEFWVALTPKQIFGGQGPSEVEAKKMFIKSKLKEDRKSRNQVPDPGPSDPLPYMISSPPSLSPITPVADAPDANPIQDGPVFSEVIIVDPQVLWLPPDRIGLDLNDHQTLYKAVCNSLGSVRLQGHDFFLHLKKDRKDFAQDWYLTERCIVLVVGKMGTS